jgi:hypothetical protein
MNLSTAQQKALQDPLVLEKASVIMINHAQFEAFDDLDTKAYCL